MNVLGISSLDKESTATVVREGRIVAAVSEERLSRVKQQGGFPAKAVDLVLRLSGLTTRDVDRVAYPFFSTAKELRLLGQSALRDFAAWPEKQRRRGSAATMRHYAAFAKTVALMGRRLNESDRQLAAGLGSLGLSDRLRRYDHQYSHAVSAYYTSGFDRALIVTLDWYGSGKAGSVYLAEGGALRLIDVMPFPDSLGVLFAQVTAALGFTPDRHEGKIVGLAACGQPLPLGTEVLARFAESEDGYRFLDPFASSSVRAVAGAHSREDVAAAHQWVLETVAIRKIVFHLRRLGLSSVAAAGGVFANVKLNERILELPEVDHLFVHPAMTDMGTGTGAAMAAAIEAGDISKPAPIGSVFLGPEYSDDEIQRALAASGARFEHEPDMPRRVAGLLAAGKVVGRFVGRMEYGPRALGNRSVLASTADRGTTDILNDKLKRNDFMPFAPATLVSAAARCYPDVDKVMHAATFMTVCLRCSAWMKEVSPGAVHVDGTARPQIVSRESNPDFHQILEHYERLTGIPSVINTSFNIHEEPIVCSPEDAIRVFRLAELDYLAIGNYLVVRAGTEAP